MPRQQSFDHLMNTGLRDRIFTGAALRVLRQESVVHDACYGTTGGEGTPAVANDTLFDLASLTKVLITTPLWMILAGEDSGVIDRPLGYWFPDAPPDKLPLTPRLLLAHCSGLPAWRPYYLHRWDHVLSCSNAMDSRWHGDTCAPEEAGTATGSRRALSSLVRERILLEPLAYDPGKGCVYSDLGFMILAAILEMETGLSLNQAAEELLARRLGIEDHLMFKPDPARNGVAHTRPGEPPGLVNDLNARSLHGVSGHAGAFGDSHGVSAVLLEYARCLDDGQRLFRCDIAREFGSRAGFVRGCTRALGFDTPDSEAPSCGKAFSKHSLGHTGFTGTSVWFDPQYRVIVVLLTNRVIMGEADLRIKHFRSMIHDRVMKEFL